ncbi:DUF2516 family protein [Tomitella fengzijianii]|nr:DUF2516 family protein [Tomitella fengzijianii]
MGVIDLIFMVTRWAAIIFGAVALIHAVRQRSDAFPAVGRLTKPVWIGIIAVALVLFFIMGALSFLGIIGVVAVGIYMADVRPKVDEIQGR